MVRAVSTAERNGAHLKDWVEGEQGKHAHLEACHKTAAHDRILGSLNLTKSYIFAKGNIGKHKNF